MPCGLDQVAVCFILVLVYTFSGERSIGVSFCESVGWKSSTPVRAGSSPHSRDFVCVVGSCAVVCVWGVICLGGLAVMLSFGGDRSRGWLSVGALLCALSWVPR